MSDTTKITVNIPASVELDLSKVLKVYSGRAGKCMCGCAGKYWYAAAHRALGSADRGYPVTEEEVSDSAVKRVVKKLATLPGVRIEKGLDGGDIIFAKNFEGRTYVIYCVPANGRPCASAEAS